MARTIIDPTTRSTTSPTRCRLGRRAGARQRPPRRLQRRSDGKPELTWYINPDAGGQDAVAENCSTDEYTIDTQVLPQDSSQQRIQLSRRLAAEDPEIDLMSLDPPFTAEFADAGFLADVPQEAKAQLEEQGTFQGAMDAATWEDKLVVFPFWSNTQVLWYRKSFVEKAGIDMSQPVTWDQIIDAAADNGGQIGVQANKYEGYSVWINALIEGAGGQLVENAEKGVDLDLTIDSEQGAEAAKIIEKLASSERGSRRPQRVQRGHGRVDLRRRQRLVPGQLDLHLPQLRRDRPRRRQGHRLHPLPADGGGRGVAAALRRHRHRRQRVLRRQGARPGGRRLPGGAGEPGHQRRDDRQHAGQHGRLRLSRAGRACTPRTSCSSSRTASTQRPPARSRPTGATSPARCRTPGTRRPASTRTHPRSRRTSPSRSWKEGDCCEHHSATPTGRRVCQACGERPVRGREQARPQAGGPGRGDDAAGHRLADGPGALPVALPLPR